MHKISSREKILVSPAPLHRFSPTPSRCDKIGGTMEDDRNSTAVDLRPVVARLREIERTCRSMGSRNEEFPLMQARVAKIIAVLEAGEESDGGPLDFRRIARELFPVAHLFESTGFLSVGKEISHIERSLMEFAPDSESDVGSPSRPSPRGFASTSAAKQTVEPRPEPREESVETRSAPLPVIVGLLLLVVVAAGAAAIVLGIGPFARRRAPVSVVGTRVATETATPTLSTPTPLPTSTPTRGFEPTAIPRGRLVAEISSARLALAKGDLETAAAHLSEAARIDRTEPDLKEIAEAVVRGFVGRADAAADDARWDEAAPYLERAERTAMRFGIGTSEIDRARDRIAAMERFVIVDPGDRRTILSSIGRRVEVILTGGATRMGRIDGIEGGDLVLDMDSEVGGGTVRFTEEVPLSTIRSLKIFED